ncbi:MAG: DUF4304 domain-containing protein [Arthrobacter sp.]|nr:DUF4304 domain-containing protein [Arthrobacter sp.]
MTAQQALKAALRDVLGPRARAQGFRGSAPTWRKSTPEGDWAVVNVQSSISSTAEHLKCIINVAVAPEPWLRWESALLGSATSRTVSEASGLYRDRISPAGGPPDHETWWEVTDDASALSAVADMVSQLEVSGWPILDRLLRPGGMLSQIRLGSLGHVKGDGIAVSLARAEALLLMDRGPSAELGERLQFALDNCAPMKRESTTRFVAWVREQAQSAR